MKKTALFSLLCLIMFSAGGQILIRNTNVMDVEKKKVLAGYDVLVMGERIVSVEKGKKSKLPDGTVVIDGTGKYLSPGFGDAHVHFFQSGGLFARPDAIDLRKHKPYSKEISWTMGNMEDFLRRYMSAGITSVIDVGATENYLNRRLQFKDKSFSPQINMTGPLLTTYLPPQFKDLGKDAPFMEMKTEESVRQSVRDQIAMGADFIKIWYIVLNEKQVEAEARKSLPLITAAIDEAHKHKIKVAVHAVERITAELSVLAGADFLVHGVEDELVSEEFVLLLKKWKTVVCPTLVVAGNYTTAFGSRQQFSVTELGLSNPVAIGTILDFPQPDTAIGKAYRQYANAKTTIKKEAHTDSIRQVNLKRLLDGGVIIATGTDAGNIGTQHAGSYFDELDAMRASGMDYWQVLQASTFNVARALGKEALWGSIARNKLASMVLLDGNPVDSFSNWQKINFIINRGHLLRPDTLIVSTPEMLAQQQLNAYNAHNLEAFLAPYSDSVEIYDFPNKLSMKGKEEMRKQYQFITRVPKLYCKLLNRMVQGNTVIDHEEVFGFGNNPVYGIAIYIIEKGKIAKVYFTQ